MFQDLMLAWRALACLGLKAELPMTLEAGNKGAVGLRSSWPAGGRARRASAKQRFLRGLKEVGIARATHRAGALMASGILAKSTPRDIFERHGSKLYGEDKYCKQHAEPKCLGNKEKREIVALASVWKGIAEMPPLRRKKAPASRPKQSKKGSRKSKRPKRASSKGECLGAQRAGAAAA